MRYFLHVLFEIAFITVVYYIVAHAADRGCRDKKGEKLVLKNVYRETIQIRELTKNSEKNDNENENSC